MFLCKIISLSRPQVSFRDALDRTRSRLQQSSISETCRARLRLRCLELEALSADFTQQGFTLLGSMGWDHANTIRSSRSPLSQFDTFFYRDREGHVHAGELKSAIRHFTPTAAASTQSHFQVTRSATSAEIQALPLKPAPLLSQHCHADSRAPKDFAHAVRSKHNMTGFLSLSKGKYELTPPSTLPSDPPEILTHASSSSSLAPQPCSCHAPYHKHKAPVLSATRSHSDASFSFRHRYITLMPVFRQLYFGAELLASGVRDLVFALPKKMLGYDTCSWVKASFLSYTRRDARLQSDLQARFGGNLTLMLQKMNGLSSHRKDYIKVQTVAACLSVPLFFAGIVPGAICLGISLIAGGLKMQYDPAPYAHYISHHLQHLCSHLEDHLRSASHTDSNLHHLNALKSELDDAIQMMAAYYKQLADIQAMEKSCVWYRRIFNGAHRFSKSSHEYVQLNAQDSILVPHTYKAHQFHLKTGGFQRLSQMILGGMGSMTLSILSGLSRIGVLAASIGSLSGFLSPVFTGMQFFKHHIVETRLHKHYDKLLRLQAHMQDPHWKHKPIGRFHRLFSHHHHHHHAHPHSMQELHLE